MRWVVRSLVALDASVINLCERFTRKLQVLTGKNNFFFANTCLAGIIGLTLHRIFFLSDLKIDHPFLILGCIIMLIYSHSEEKFRTESLFKGVANPRKIISIVIFGRFFLVVILLLALGNDDFYTTHNLELFLLNQYLMACDPLPPCRSKAMEWVKGLFSPRGEMASDSVRS